MSILYYSRLRASLYKEPQLVVIQSVSEVCQSKLNLPVRVNNCNNSLYEHPVQPIITRWFEVTFCYLIEKKKPPTNLRLLFVFDN